MEKIKLTAGIFILLVVVGTTYYVTIDDPVYFCEDTNLVGLCWKLSKINDFEMQTRCYYIESSPTRYKNCKTGWVEYNQTEFTGILLNDSKTGFDINMSSGKINVLYEIGIIEPRITPCIKIDNYTCKIKILDKGINKELIIDYQYCSNPEKIGFETICHEWKILTQEELEDEVVKETNKLLNKIAEVQVQRNEQEQKIVMTSEIIINLEIE